VYKRFDFIFVAAAALAVVPLAAWWAADARSRRELRAEQEAERRRLAAEADRATSRLEADLAAVRHPYRIAEDKAHHEAEARGLNAVAVMEVVQQLNARNYPEERRKLLAVYARHGVEPPQDLVAPRHGVPQPGPGPSLTPPRKAP
jgi:hypothetical protein